MKNQKKGKKKKKHCFFVRIFSYSFLFFFSPSSSLNFSVRSCTILFSLPSIPKKKKKIGILLYFYFTFYSVKNVVSCFSVNVIFQHSICSVSCVEIENLFFVALGSEKLSILSFRKSFVWRKAKNER